MYTRAFFIIIHEVPLQIVHAFRLALPPPENSSETATLPSLLFKRLGTQLKALTTEVCSLSRLTIVTGAGEIKKTDVGSKNIF